MINESVTKGSQGGSMRTRNFFIGLLFLLTLSCGSRNSSSQRLQINSDESSGIVGGIEVSASDPFAKHTVLVHYYQKKETTSPRPREYSKCSGVIVGNKSILTAAHCFDSYKEGLKNFVEVYFTQTGEKLEALAFSGSMINGIDLIIHPYYIADSDFNNHFDISLVTLSKAVPSGYEPVPLLPADVELKVGDTVYPVGFGKTVNNDTDSNKRLNKSKGLKVIEDWGTFYLVDQSAGSGACSGDSGGPSFMAAKGRFYLVGITQAIYGKVGDGSPSDCTKKAGSIKVQTFKAWIQKNTTN